jgi:hypothetical protein
MAMTTFGRELRSTAAATGRRSDRGAERAADSVGDGKAVASSERTILSNNRGDSFLGIRRPSFARRYARWPALLLLRRPQLLRLDAFCLQLRAAQFSHSIDVAGGLRALFVPRDASL